MDTITQLGKPPLLFLCHRIPYPPNKGDKIRSFHLLHHLSRYFDIYLATFIDDPADKPWVSEVRKFCADSLFIEQKKWPARLRSAAGLVSGQALSIPYYASGRMQQWVNDRVKEQCIRHVMVFSSSMAQYVLECETNFERVVVDFVDVDSDKWQQYSEMQKWPMNWLYSREASCLLAYEKRLATAFDAGLFVSSSEAELFRRLSPGTANKIGHYNNGVNSDYFNPLPDTCNPYPGDISPIVFTGAMDYWPNIDAVVWFVQYVLPKLREENPGIFFYIVGSNPAKTVVDLGRVEGVVVTGRVEDIRPYLQYATLAVAPMRVARGVQNKVLEAMAMARCVMVSDKGLEGIDARNGEHVLVANSAEDYVKLTDEVLAGKYADAGDRARSFVIENFNWDNNLPEVVLLLGLNPETGYVGEAVEG